MAIYIGLIIFILLITCILSCTENNLKRRQKKIAFWGMLAVFLVLALKAPSVGTDIFGYSQQYYIAEVMPWSDFDYVYFEKGYILLEKIFSKIGVSFQLYTVLIYGVEAFAWYKLFSKYSKDTCLSILFIICYQFFVFSMSGLRQAIAMSICIFAFLAFNQFNTRGTVLSIVLTAAAVGIHQSAVAYIFVVAAVLITKAGRRVGLINIVALIGGAFFCRGVLWRFVNLFLKRVDVGAEVSLGGAFWFQLLIFAFSLFTFLRYYGTRVYLSRSTSSTCQNPYEESLTLRLSLYTIATYILFSGGVLLRSTMYMTMFVTAFIPHLIYKYTRGSRTIIKVVLVIVLIYTFYTQTLITNQLNILPYRFYWQ